ncbi:MAG: hypothetical protein HY692_02875, partial [Cyanobacteria bacterium NC_groundwater_1444_Ag_S-0.65um_54_12]|nr:hypothetical protein [Cyanobacteria bacterium NC_groundwater_1444_Ag_S-0.65um_54_12]
IQEIFNAALGASDLEIKVASLKSSDLAALITESEHGRRLKEMSALWRHDKPLATRKTLVINTKSPLVQRLLGMSSAGADELCHHLYDLARLAHDGLQGEELATFIARSHRLLTGDFS